MKAVHNCELLFNVYSVYRLIQEYNQWLYQKSLQVNIKCVTVYPSVRFHNGNSKPVCNSEIGQHQFA